MKDAPRPDDRLSRDAILSAARAQVRRFGGAKTNVVDIARALGTSHTTIYRHFSTKSEVFDAIVQDAMRDEEELARTFVESRKLPQDRLLGLVLALHRRKRERFAEDPEVYQLYRRIVEERPEIVAAYAAAITGLVARILGDAVKQDAYHIDDVAAAAGVVRDAAMIFVHPAHVAAGVAAGLPMEDQLRRVMRTLDAAFRAGVRLADGDSTAT